MGRKSVLAGLAAGVAGLSCVVRLTHLDPFLLDSQVSLLCRLADHAVQCNLLSYNKRLLDRWEVRDLAGLQHQLLSLGLGEAGQRATASSPPQSPLSYRAGAGRGDSVVRGTSTRHE